MIRLGYHPGFNLNHLIGMPHVSMPSRGMNTMPILCLARL